MDDHRARLRVRVAEGDAARAGEDGDHGVVRVAPLHGDLESARPGQAEAQDALGPRLHAGQRLAQHGDGGGGVGDRCAGACGRARAVTTGHQAGGDHGRGSGHGGAGKS